MSLAATRELARVLGVEPLALLQANRDRPWTYEQGSLAFASVMEGDVLRSPDGGEVVIARMGFLGASFSDFATPGSGFSAKWDEIQTQLTSEGLGVDESNLAKQLFTEQYASMASQFGIDPADAADYAKAYTVAARTISGAVDTVEGLVASAQGGSPQQLQAAFQTMTGLLIGGMVAAGAVSAGVGSLIVAGAGALLGALESAGLFGTAPSGTEICPGFYVNPAPAWVVGCAAAPSSALRASPGSAAWRRFPEPATDAGWYGGPWNSVVWHGDTWVWPSPPAPGTLLNPSASASAPVPGIAYALPVFGRVLGTSFYLGQNSSWSWFLPFHLAFFAAWKANQEYAFNGYKTKSDWDVLKNVATLWNRAHDGSTYVDLDPASAGDVVYERELVGLAAYSSGANNPADQLYNGKLRIHTGAKKTPPRHINFHLGPAPSAPSAGLSTGGKAAVAGGVAAVAAGGLWLALGKPLSIAAFQTAFGHWLDRL